MSIGVARWLAIGLAIIHIALATWYSSETPYRTPGVVISEHRAVAQDIGAPDERQHVNYVKHILSGQGFPVLVVKDKHLYENYQSHQPPAFYLLAAGWCVVTGSTNLDDPDAGKRLRFLNALLGGAEVFCVFLLGSIGFKKPEVGVLSASFAALLPMNVALSGAVNNDVLLFTLCTATLAIGALGLQDGWTNRRCLAAGVCLGLALLTKTTALALVPAMWVAVLAAGKSMPKAVGWALAVAPILVLTLPWFLRNQHLYGDPLAMSVFKSAFPGSAQAKDLIQAYGFPTYLLNLVLWWTLRSFFGAFGYMDIWLTENGSPYEGTPNALYRVLIALSVVAFIGWIMSWKSYRGDRTVQVRLMNLTFFVVIVLLFLSFNLQYFQAQARYVLPAIGPIACGYAVGALTLCKEKWLPALFALVIVFGGTSVYAGVRLPVEFAQRT